jgi:hypothetical protein
MTYRQMLARPGLTCSRCYNVVDILIAIVKDPNMETKIPCNFCCGTGLSPIPWCELRLKRFI